MGTRFLDYEVFNNDRYEIQFLHAGLNEWHVETYYYNRAQARFECKRLKHKMKSLKFRVVKIIEHTVKTTLSA